MIRGNQRDELALAAGAIFLGLLLHLIIIPWQVNVASAQTDEMSPAFFPHLVAYTLITVGAVSLLTQMRALRIANSSDPLSVDTDDARMNRVGPIGTGFTLIAWPLLAPNFGFFTTLVLAIASMQYFLRPWHLSHWMRHVAAAVVAIVGASAIVGLFSWLLGVPLPKGKIW